MNKLQYTFKTDILEIPFESIEKFVIRNPELFGFDKVEKETICAITGKDIRKKGGGELLRPCPAADTGSATC